MTVPRATLRIKFRYSAKIDPTEIVAAVHDSAQRAGLALTETREGFPPHAAIGHPLIRLCSDLTGLAPRTAPYGTDASELQALAPCVILGPGDIGEAHTPGEKVRTAELVQAIPIMIRLAERIASA
jgi:acetylornithine deacetylase/succinyl-diaminopimelate desuccinylase-like protein